VVDGGLGVRFGNCLLQGIELSGELRASDAGEQTRNDQELVIGEGGEE
jgi:hypothetical protein